MGKFMMKRTETGIIFHLKAANGETIGFSNPYPSEEACKEGIETVRKCIPDAELEDRTFSRFKEKNYPKFELVKGKDGKFCFRLLSATQEELLRSQGYTAKASCKNGINSVIKNAPDAVLLRGVQ